MNWYQLFMTSIQTRCQTYQWVTSKSCISLQTTQQTWRMFFIWIHNEMNNFWVEGPTLRHESVYELKEPKPTAETAQHWTRLYRWRPTVWRQVSQTSCSFRSLWLRARFLYYSYQTYCVLNHLFLISNSSLNRPYIFSSRHSIGFLSFHVF